MVCACVGDEIGRCDVFKLLLDRLTVSSVNKFSVHGVIVVEGLLPVGLPLTLDDFIQLGIESQLSTCGSEQSPKLVLVGLVRG